MNLLAQLRVEGAAVDGAVGIAAPTGSILRVSRNIGQVVVQNAFADRGLDEVEHRRRGDVDIRSVYVIGPADVDADQAAQSARGTGANAGWQHAANADLAVAQLGLNEIVRFLDEFDRVGAARLDLRSLQMGEPRDRGKRCRLAIHIERRLLEERAHLRGLQHLAGGGRRVAGHHIPRLERLELHARVAQRLGRLFRALRRRLGGAVLGRFEGVVRHQSLALRPRIERSLLGI